jgi:hypothetical protein
VSCSGLLRSIELTSPARRRSAIMVEAAALARKLTLVETPTPLASSNNTPGLIVADILAYLKSWDVIHPNPDQTAQAALGQSGSRPKAEDDS